MFCVNPGNAACANDAYRRVLCTASNFQLVVMNLKPNEIIKREKHDDAAQFFLVEEGNCTITLFLQSKQKHCLLSKGDSVTIFAGHFHRVDAGPRGARIMTIYSKPQHESNLIQMIATDQE